MVHHSHTHHHIIIGKRLEPNSADNIKVCSDFRNKDFANAYGVLLADGPLAGILARVIFVIGKDGKVTYKQVVPEITQEPNYEEALEAAKEATK